MSLDEIINESSRGRESYNISSKPLKVSCAESRREFDPSSTRRPEVIHIYGTDLMQTDDIFAIFKDYNPRYIEWLDDSSCNVVFSDGGAAKWALQSLGSPVDGDDRWYLLKYPSNSTSVDRSKGISWELQMREAVTADVKLHKQKLSSTTNGRKNKRKQRHRVESYVKIKKSRRFRSVMVDAPLGVLPGLHDSRYGGCYMDWDSQDSSPSEDGEYEQNTQINGETSIVQQEWFSERKRQDATMRGYSNRGSFLQYVNSCENDIPFQKIESGETGDLRGKINAAIKMMEKELPFDSTVQLNTVHPIKEDLVSLPSGQLVNMEED